MNPYHSRRIEEFLTAAMNPPTVKMIRQAIERLVQLGALMRETLTRTELGRQMAQMPLDPKLSRTIILSDLFDVAAPVIRICAGMSYRPPFLLPTDPFMKTKASEARMKIAGAAADEIPPSDHYLLWKVMEEYQAFFHNGNHHHSRFVGLYLIGLGF